MEEVVEEEAPLQEVAAVKTPVIKPSIPKAKIELDPREAAKLLDGWVRKHLTDPEDLETFEVRQGVTFVAEPMTKAPILEVFLRDVLYLIPVPIVAGVVERKTYDIFAQGILDRLRDRFHYKSHSYSRIELLCELLYEMRDLLPEGIPECHDFPENSSARFRRQIRLIKEKVRERIQQPQRVKQATGVGRRG